MAPLNLAGQAPPAISGLNPSDSPALDQAVGDLIRSSDLKDKTWGAYLAGKLSLSELLPDLERLLQRQFLGSARQEKWLTSAVLDALIQARAAVPPEKLLPHKEEFPDQVLILLALHPKENADVLLGLLDEPLPDVHRQLLRGVLTQARAPGFAAYLLRDFRITVSVLVHTPGTGGFGSSRGGGSGACRLGCTLGPELPSDYPPGACYRLVDARDAQSGAVLMAQPARTVYYIRTEVAPGSRQYTDSTSPRHTRRFDSETTDYFAALLDIPKERLSIRHSRVRHVEWHSAEDYLEQIKIIRTDINASFAELLAQLANNELLSATDDFPRKPLLEWRINDLRSDKTQPIPGMD